MAIPFLGRKNEGDTPSSPVSKVVPSVSVLAQVRRIHEGAVEDYSGNRFAVWSVRGCNCANPQVTNGWSLLLNSVDYPVQIIIRQHAPDLAGYRAKLIEDRPAHMRSGRINDVGNSCSTIFSPWRNRATSSTAVGTSSPVRPRRWRWPR